MTLTAFNELAGAGLHYDRYDPESGHGYGTRGKPFSPRATVDMADRLDECFRALFFQAPHGNADVVTSAGAYVNKPGQHGKGRAFDLDGIFWAETQLIAIEYPAKPHLYLAVESVLRQYFGTVLNFNYNRAHEDHFHMDLGTSVGFNRMSKSRVEYLQASMFYVHDMQVGVDGIWGPETGSASRIVLSDLGVTGGLSTKANWLKYLDMTAAKAFERHIAS